MDDVLNRDALGQAELVREGRVTPGELVEGVVDRIEAVNPELNAVVRPMYDLARERVEEGVPEGPFQGVPFLLKDLQAAYAGVPLTFGSTFLEDFVPDHDSYLVEHHKESGLIVLGKTNTPEFGILPTTEPDLFGPCRNPWDTERSTGGSSGGSAAMVAAGVVPMAHANDGGGSVRIPASCCGLFGLKPTRARNSLGPDVGDLINGLVVEHAVTRSVRDSAALLDVTRGYRTGDPYVAPPPERPYREEVGRDPGELKIGMTLKSPLAGEIHPDCQEAVRDAAELCEDLGHHVEEYEPDVDADTLNEVFISAWSAGTAAGIDGTAFLSGNEPTREQFETLTWGLYEMGQGISAPDYLMAIQLIQAVSRDIMSFFDDYDVWLTPTLAEPPLPLGTLDSPEDEPLYGLIRAGEYVPFTPICNMTGQPAMSVPLFWNDEGLPIGTHFAGDFGAEGLLFRLAAQLEEARPWADRTPPVYAG